MLLVLDLLYVTHAVIWLQLLIWLQLFSVMTHTSLKNCKQGAEDETADLKTTSSGRPVFLLLYMLTQFSQATVATSAAKRSEGRSHKYDTAMMAFSPPGGWKPRKWNRWRSKQVSVRVERWGFSECKHGQLKHFSVQWLRHRNPPRILKAPVSKGNENKSWTLHLIIMF